MTLWLRFKCWLHRLGHVTPCRRCGADVETCADGPTRCDFGTACYEESLVEEGLKRIREERGREALRIRVAAEIERRLRKEENENRT